jgi:hypothetical protein
LDPINIIFYLAPLISTPHSSLLSTISANDTDMKLKQQLEREAQLIPGDTESPNASSSTALNQENRSNKMPPQSDLKEKSSSNESTPLENNVAREVKAILLIDYVDFVYFLLFPSSSRMQSMIRQKKTQVFIHHHLNLNKGLDLSCIIQK